MSQHVGTARLDCLVLLEDELQKDRSWILAHPENKLTDSQLRKLSKRVTRRANHEPLAYIRGFTEFYGRRFKINKRVLEPRPESEAMIDLLKEITSHKPQALRQNLRLMAKGSRLIIADIGTGSGAIGITAALELHNHNIDLYDIDAAALAVAKHNVVMHELNLQVRKRDLLNRPLRSYDILLANLPYVPNHWKLNSAAEMEPRVAIFGGKDGLDIYRRFFEQISKMAQKPAYVLTESLPPQHKDLAQIAKSAGYKQLKTRDFIQAFQSL